MYKGISIISMDLAEPNAYVLPPPLVRVVLHCLPLCLVLWPLVQVLCWHCVALLATLFGCMALRAGFVLTCSHMFVSDRFLFFYGVFGLCFSSVVRVCLVLSVLLFFLLFFFVFQEFFVCFMLFGHDIGRVGLGSDSDRCFWGAWWSTLI